MKSEPKYLKVLKYLYDRKPKSIHYLELTHLVFSDEIIKRYRGARNCKPVIDGMICRYMGKLSAKDYVQAEYKAIGNYTYFVGYYIRAKGVKLIEGYND